MIQRANTTKQVTRRDERRSKGMDNPDRPPSRPARTTTGDDETPRGAVRETETGTSLENVQRATLLALRARLLGDLNGMAEAALKPNGNEMGGNAHDLADMASDSLDQELTLSLLGGKREMLEQIEAALKRIDDGTYGRCERCQTEIPRARLEVLPYAPRCVGCASRLERRQRLA